MKLEKFSKNKKQKEIIIGFILVLIAIIGGISLIASFAMYEEKASFDVLKGTVPDFRIGKGDVNFIALIVNGEKTSKVPLKTNAEYEVEVTCDKGATGEWDKEKWGVTVTSMAEVPTSCTINFTYEGESFNYTGNEQIFTVPVDGRYKLEVWGAEGGKWSSSVQGGYGGYATGEINLTQGEELHVYVGGSGVGGDTHVAKSGGYNGGGDAFVDGDGNTRQSSGGGATHIALVTGLLSTLEEQQDKILIVAGGGGGSGRNSVDAGEAIGGSGGGFEGTNGKNKTSNGLGGTQTEGGKVFVSGVFYEEYSGKFGLGGKYVYSGGGGGFYGGAGLETGGGGSGYIGNALLTNKAMYCYQCKTNEESDTKTILTQSVSSNPISQSAKQGNGYAKITYLGSN